jgi:hypothetical protein
MSYLLKSDEIMEALQIADHPRAARLIAMVEGAVNCAAWDLAQHLGVKCGVGDFQGVAYAGLCVPFYQASEGQEMPDAIACFDDSEGWEDSAQEDGEDSASSTADAPRPTACAPDLQSLLRDLSGFLDGFDGCEINNLVVAALQGRIADAIAAVQMSLISEAPAMLAALRTFLNDDRAENDGTTVAFLVPTAQYDDARAILARINREA